MTTATKKKTVARAHAPRALEITWQAAARARLSELDDLLWGMNEVMGSTTEFDLMIGSVTSVRNTIGQIVADDNQFTEADFAGLLEKIRSAVQTAVDAANPHDLHAWRALAREVLRVTDIARQPAKTELAPPPERALSQHGYTFEDLGRAIDEIGSVAYTLRSFLVDAEARADGEHAGQARADLRMARYSACLVGSIADQLTGGRLAGSAASWIAMEGIEPQEVTT